MSDQLLELADDSEGTTEAEAVDSSIEGENPSATQSEDNQELPEALVYDIDGEEATLDEIKAWKSGHMKDADYTQKTQKLAEDRKNIQKEREELTAQMEAFSALRSDIEKLALGDLENVDLNDLLENEDAAEYLKAKHSIDTRKSKVGEVMGKFAEIEQQQTAKAQQKLVDGMGWADEAKQKAEVEAIQSYAKSAGIDNQTISKFARLGSPELMTAIIEANKYRELMSRKEAAKKQTPKAPKTSKPSANASKPKLTLAERLYGAKN